MEPREVRRFAPGHAVSKEKCLNVNPVTLTPNDSSLDVTRAGLP